MIISVEENGDKRILKVSGSLTVANSLKLKKTVSENLKQGSRLRLDIGNATEIDLSFIQILVAAIKTAEKDDRDFTLKMPVPEPVVESLKLSGFLNHSSCGKPGCVWCTILEQVQGE